MNQSSLIKSIIDVVNVARQNNILCREIFANSMIEARHEFLFFIKPEITLQAEKNNLSPAMEMIFKKINEFDLGIRRILLLTAPYLEKHNIIAQHYGVINAIARDVKANLTEKAANVFAAQFNATINESNVYGGLEFLQAFPAFTAVTLDYLWQNSPTVKLGGGAYCQALKIDGKPVFLVNGFHPRQLEHYTAKGRSIVAFTLVGNLEWSEARNRFVGKTNPQNAEPGSIRRVLLENKDRYGLQTINSSWNGVHLSAGPVESLVELIRYNSDFENDTILKPSDFVFGKLLTECFNAETLGKIIENQTILFRGKKESIFDITEEKNNDEALSILKEAFA
jgi:hypothetical protein